jgi:hypothetical protein
LEMASRCGGRYARQHASRTNREEFAFEDIHAIGSANYFNFLRCDSS